jgi:chloride channel protein, CIC family
VSLSPEDSLDTALQRMVSLDVEELPITDARDEHRVTGLLSRRDIIATYNRRRLEGASPGE